MSSPLPPDANSWRVEPGSGRGRSHGTSGAASFDRWFRYPAGFATDYVELLLDRLQLDEGTVIDCFAGSGVTGTAARARGLGFVGIEAHPMIAELARAKLIPEATGEEVRQLTKETSEAARAAISGWSGSVASEPERVRRSYSDETLRDLLRLRDAVRDRLDEPGGLHLKWALLATLRDVASVKVGWPYQRPGVTKRPKYTDAIGRFEARANLIADDLDSVIDSPTSAQVLVGDSRDPRVWARLDAPASACITSPPYLNNFDYGDATRLELYFWGEITTWREMRETIWSGMVTATTQQSSVGEKSAAVERLKTMSTPTASEILELVDAISEAKRERNRRSKEYDQVAPAYFTAISEILTNLHAGLEPGSMALWLVGDSAPYGVYVDTPRLIGRLASEVGFDFVGDVPLRARGDRWGTNNDRHKVPLAERLVVMRKPLQVG